MAGPGAFARTLVTGSIAALLSTAVLSAPLDCAKLVVSVQPEPPGYAAQCRAGLEALRPPAMPQAPQTAGTAYFLNLRSGGPFGQQLLNAPFPTLSYVSVGPQAAPIFAMDFDPSATTLYGIDNASRNLGTISTSTGAFTPAVPVTGVAGDTISGMSIDPTTGTVYITATTGAPATLANLYTLNLGSGVATLVGPITGYPAIVDIAVSNGGKLYAHDVGGDRILRIDKTTGAATEVGATGFDANFAQGMDFDPTTDILWLSLYLGGGQQRLARIDLATGTATILGSTSNEELEIAIQASQPALQPFLRTVHFGTGPFTDILLPDVDTSAKTYWENVGSVALPSGPGILTNFVGPIGPTYSILDSNGSYPSIAPGAIAPCTDCYTIRASGTRPAQHWDAGIVEVLPTPGAFQGFDFHVGNSFGDVPWNDPYFQFVETIFHRGITGGCAPGAFCPDDPVTREQMAVFVLTSKYPGLNPPACVPPNIFGDVPESSPFCRWIEELSNRGVVVGCGGGNYCPGDPVTREQMAVFVLRTRHGNDFIPPACTTPVFGDVPASSPFCRFVEELSRRGVTAGCGGGNYCPADSIPRDQAAVFLAALFPPYAFEIPTPTPGPTAPASGALSRASVPPDPRGGSAVGIALLLIGFASAIGLPIALRRADRESEAPTA
jgi:hypothetical protein